MTGYLMSARIYQPAKTAMQSGRSRTKKWVLDFEPTSKHNIEPLMGYISSKDMHSQISCQFETKKDAIAYAEKHELHFIVMEPKQKKRQAVSYSDNFKYSRKTPWTH